MRDHHMVGGSRPISHGRSLTLLLILATFLAVSRATTSLGIVSLPGSTVRLANAPTGTTVSGRLGFDSCAGHNNQPSPSALQSWYTGGTPWYNFYVYIGGSMVNCGSEITASYISQANSIGYGLLPIWGGPQAPCGPGGISYNTSTAFTQGTSEANTAIGHAFSLGFRANNAIVYDMEYYPLNNQSCIAATNSFVNGWDQQAGALGWTSAVYSNPANLNSFFQGVNGRGITYPSAVWMADHGGSPNVWNVSGLGNGSWSYDQRYSQYRGTHTEKWGNVTLSIDSDCANSYMDGHGYEIYGESGEGTNDPGEDPSC